MSFNKVGDVLVAQGKLPEALKSYRDSLTLADRLAKSDLGPRTTGVQPGAAPGVDGSPPV